MMKIDFRTPLALTLTPSEIKSSIIAMTKQCMSSETLGNNTKERHEHSLKGGRSSRQETQSRVLRDGSMDEMLATEARKDLSFVPQHLHEIHTQRYIRKPSPGEEVRGETRDCSLASLVT